MVTTISVGGLTWAGEPGHFDADGVEWVFRTLVGWDDQVDVEADQAKRPRAHGVFQQRAWRGGRLVQVTGGLVAPSPAAAIRAKRSLSALLADGQTATMTVTEDGESLSADVQLGGAPEITHVRGGRLVLFAFQFWSADPLRYGEIQATSTTFPVLTGGLEYDLYTDGAGADLGYLDYGDIGASGRLVLSNDGTADSWPQFVIDGPVDDAGFEIVAVGSGARVTFAGPVPAGSQLVLDSATGSAVIDGSADRGGRLTHRDWTAIPAGRSVEFAFIALGASSAAVLHATVRPAFW